MKTLDEFKIPFIGLKEGKHHFDYQIDRTFFDAFNYDEFEKVDFNVNVVLDKKAAIMELYFTAIGTVNVPCDVTGEDFDLEINGKLRLIVKFGQFFNNDNEELLILPHNAYELELQQYIYELIILSIPQRRVKPGAEDNLLNDSEKVKEKLEVKEDKNKEVDPRWDQLKQLLDKK